MWRREWKDGVEAEVKKERRAEGERERERKVGGMEFGIEEEEGLRHGSKGEEKGESR